MILRPKAWKSGTDEYKHSMYRPYTQKKALANYNNQEWKLTFDEFYGLWREHWNDRGMKPENYAMTRLNKSKPWEYYNVAVVKREVLFSEKRTKK